MFRSGGNGLIVFVVDDENVIASTIELLLLSQGFDARSFVDPLDALEAAQSEAPNLLITDLAMPCLNGIELAIRITKRHPVCKVILFSGEAGLEDLVADGSLHGHDFHLLLKPIHPNTLIREIKELVGHDRLRDDRAVR